MIKRLSISAFALAFVCLIVSPVQSQILSLWGDEAMTTCQVSTTAPYTPFNVYVFLEPGAEGAFAGEYKLVAPAGHFSTGQVVNPVISGATIGVWYGAPGISAPFTSCQADLFWVVNMTMMSPNTTPGHYILEPHDSTQFLGVAICPDPRPLVDAHVYNYFYFNDSWGATEESSWGAIKALSQ